MTINKTLYCIGYASDTAAAKRGTADGPFVLKDSSYFLQLEQQGIQVHWDAMLRSDPKDPAKLNQVVQICEGLAIRVQQLVNEKKSFLVLGGDHSSAIGTWSGASHATEGPLGLIWIDAHMDSHTFDTSETGNIHGMPLAALLGQGDPKLTHLLNNKPKLLPENVCLIGVRSFEQGEADLLKKLNVKIYGMQAIKEKGLDAVMQEAVARVSENTAAFGVTIDIDSMDPKDAPGTGVAEPDGIPAEELRKSLRMVASHPKLLGAEIVEFDPKRDKNQITEKLVAELVVALVE